MAAVLHSRDNLAGCTRGYILTIIAGLAASQADITPGPIAAAVLGAQNVDLLGVIFKRTSDAVHSQIGDRDTVSRGTSRRTVLIVLLDNNAVVGDTGEGDIGKGHLAD